MKSDKFQDKYDEIFQNLKEEKMNWDFEDFLKQAENPQKDEKIIPIQQKNKPSVSKFFWMAASVALLLGVLFFVKFLKPTSLESNNSFAKTESPITKIHENSVLEMPKQDSLVSGKKDSVIQNMATDKEAEEMMDKILSKKSRLKKTPRGRYAKTEVINSKENKISTSEKILQNTEYQDTYVTINGQKIENEKEAIDVAKYSLQMLSDKVAQTVAQADYPITDLE